MDMCWQMLAQWRQAAHLFLEFLEPLLLGLELLAALLQMRLARRYLVQRRLKERLGSPNVLLDIDNLLRVGHKFYGTEMRNN